MNLKITSLITLSLIFFSNVATAADTKDKLIEESLSLIEELSSALSSVKDKATAQKALPALNNLVKKNEALKHRRQKLGLPEKFMNEEAKTNLMIKKRIEASQKKIIDAMTKLSQKPEALEIILSVLSKF